MTTRGTRRINHAEAGAEGYCPYCGQPLSADEPALGQNLGLRPVERRIFAILVKHGAVYRPRLHAALYGSDPDGGPDPRTVDTIICQMNKRLKAHGLVVRQRIRHRKGEPIILARLDPGMHHWKCTGCHHEWDGARSVCDWCGSPGSPLARYSITGGDTATLT